jgi:hypothetical protein
VCWNHPHHRWFELLGVPNGTTPGGSDTVEQSIRGFVVLAVVLLCFFTAVVQRRHEQNLLMALSRIHPFERYAIDIVRDSLRTEESF